MSICLVSRDTWPPQNVRPPPADESEELVVLGDLRHTNALHEDSTRRSTMRQVRCSIMVVTLLTQSMTAVHAQNWSLSNDGQIDVLWCLPVEASDDARVIMDAQKAVYQAVFEDHYNLCDDFCLTLDSPLTGDIIPGFATGTNSAGEPFGLDIVDWSEIDASMVPPGDAQKFEDWGITAGFIWAEIQTDLGVIPIAAFAESYDDPGDGQGRVNTLIPFCVVSQQAYDALRLYGCGPAGLGDGDDDDCKDGCWDHYQEDVQGCKDSSNMCKFLIGLGAVGGCVFSAGATCVAFFAAYNGCVQAEISCLENAERDYQDCLDLCDRLERHKALPAQQETR